MAALRSLAQQGYSYYVVDVPDSDDDGGGPGGAGVAGARPAASAAGGAERAVAPASGGAASGAAGEAAEGHGGARAAAVAEGTYLDVDELMAGDSESEYSNDGGDDDDEAGPAEAGPARAPAAAPGSSAGAAGADPPAAAFPRSHPPAHHSTTSTFASATSAATARADVLLAELEYLARSGVDAGSATFAQHMDAFLEAAVTVVGEAVQRPPPRGPGSDGSGSNTAAAAERAAAAARLRERATRGPGAAAAAAAAARPADDAGPVSSSDEQPGAAAQPPEFYDEAMDDADADWLAAKLAGGHGAPPVAAASHTAAAPTHAPAGSGCVLSCPYCFTAVAYDAVAHVSHANQFRSSAPAAVSVDTTTPLALADAAGTGMPSGHAAGAALFSIGCATCGTRVGVLERAPAAAGGVADAFHYFNVVPGVG